MPLCGNGVKTTDLIWTSAFEFDDILQEFGGKAHHGTHATEATAIAATYHAAHLGLDEEFHDGHCGAVDGVLLAAGAGTT